MITQNKHGDYVIFIGNALHGYNVTRHKDVIHVPMTLKVKTILSFTLFFVMFQLTLETRGNPCEVGGYLLKSANLIKHIYRCQILGRQENQGKCLVFGKKKSKFFHFALSPSL